MRMSLRGHILKTKFIRFFFAKFAVLGALGLKQVEPDGIGGGAMAGAASAARRQHRCCKRPSKNSLGQEGGSCRGVGWGERSRHCVAFGRRGGFQTWEGGGGGGGLKGLPCKVLVRDPG